MDSDRLPKKANGRVTRIGYIKLPVGREWILRAV
jgi:hypothetical protein